MIPWLLAALALHFCPPLTSSYTLTHLAACAFIMLFVQPKHKIQWSICAILVALWIFVTGIAGFFQPNWYWHLWGNYLRYEGLATWVLLYCMAYLYWRVNKGTLLLEIMAAAVLLVHTVGLIWMGDGAILMLGETKIAVAAFSCMAAVLLYTSHPAMSMLAVVPMAWANNRSAWLGFVAGVVVFHSICGQVCRFRHRWLVILAVLTALTIPLTAKIMATKFTGYGPRSQWVLQASANALQCPINGFGFDTQLDYLRNPTGSSSEAVQAKGATYKADRCHNIAFDIILQSGWVGYAMLLLALGWCIGAALKNPTGDNASLLGVLAAFLTFTLFNPSGIPAIGLALVAALGIREQRNSAPEPKQPPEHLYQGGTLWPSTSHLPSQTSNGAALAWNGQSSEQT